MKKLEYFFKNLLLNLLLLFQDKKSIGETILGNNSKILFIRLNRIGDALITTPLLHEVKLKLKPKIYVLADRKNYVAFNNNPDIDKLIIYEKGLKGIFKVLDFIKKEKIETIVDTHDDISATVSFLIALSAARNKYGLEKKNKSIYTKTIPQLDRHQNHVITRILELSKLFNFELDRSKSKVQYFPSNESMKKAESFLSNKKLQNNFLAGINISAGSYARFWGIDNFKNLLNYFSKYDLNILLLSSPSDKELCKQISGDHFNYFYSSEFDEFAAMISKLNFLFSPDTAAVHLASAFGIPTFGIYVKYNTQDMIWSPYNTNFDCVITEEPNLNNVTGEQVLTKLKPFLEKLLIKDVQNKI
ncbi:MAG: glycosyltransferase family 9 protein [Bacteroidetes bacterium]|nr:glycosyltransferase family 9 protein [Bacteroidota bacterium]